MQIARQKSHIVFSFLLIAVTVAGCASSHPRPVAATDKPQAFPFREPVIVVCDIDAVTNDPEVAGLALALAPLIRRDLFCVRQLSVIPGEDVNVSTKPYFLTKAGLRQIAETYGADIVTVGLLSAQTSSLTIEYMAYDLAADSIVFKTTVSGKQKSLFEMEKQLVIRLLDALGIEPPPDELQRIQSCRPRSYGAFVNFGSGLVSEKKGKYPETLMALQKATMDDDKVSIYHAAEARAFRGMGAPLKALQAYEKAVQKDEFFAEGWYRLNLYAAQYDKDDQKALECCRKAVEISPRFGKARLSLGTRLHDLGNVQEAIAETKLAAATLRIDPLPSYNLGLYYLEIGEHSAARQWFERALQIDPKFDFARLEIQKLHTFSP